MLRVVRIGGLLLPGLLFSLAACQGMRPTEQPAEPTVATLPVSETAAMATPTFLATPAVLAGLTGQVIGASDVTGQSDQALANQMVVAIPVAQAREFLGAGSERLTDVELRFLKANLLHADPAIVVTLSDAAGNYTLRLPPGDFVICLADSENIPPGFPARTRGCGRTHVAPGKLRRVDISSGFGEIVLLERY